MLYILTTDIIIIIANGGLPGSSGTIMGHNIQITHITQNKTTLKRNTAHKTTHTIKDTLPACQQALQPWVSLGLLYNQSPLLGF
jgi:hypothetical protein